jgi:hypothetical protein
MPVDMSAASGKPPARKAGPAPRARAAAPGKNTRQEAVEGVFQVLQAACTMTGQYADAATIGIYGEPASVEIAALGDENEAIGNGLDTLQMVGPYTKLIAILIPFGLQLAANHGRINYAKVSAVTDPKVLESRMQASLERQAMEQLAEEQEELARLHNARERANAASAELRNLN